MSTITVKQNLCPPGPGIGPIRLANQLSQFGSLEVLSFASVLWILLTLSSVHAQTLNARISIASSEPARLKIEARFPVATGRLSFLNTYAGVLGLGERIETVEGIRDNGERVRIPGLAPGEFESAEKFLRFTYDVNLVAPPRPADMSHVSSLNSDRGVLMLSDLLPQTTKDSGGFASVLINVDVPTGWTVASNAKNEGSQFSTDDPQTAVFLIGPSLQEKRQRASPTDLSIITALKWPISDNDATTIAGKILEEYSRITRFALKRNAVVMLIPYPGEVGPESWSAETRGNVVVLLLGRNAGRRKVLSRLGIVLSHELFHLWVPNSLKLEGAYDWFFEGFTLYQALRMDLRLGLISFDDFLETIARVFDSYQSSADRDRLSLIEASERRWTTSSALVYEKGMLFAFLYDLALRKLTNCHASLDDVYAELFRLPATGQRSANETIISLLSGHEELKAFAKNYVESSGNIDLGPAVSAYGIQVQRGSSGTTLVVAQNLNKAQRKLLDCVGYRR